MSGCLSSFTWTLVWFLKPVRSLQSYKRISHGRRKDSQEFKWIVSIVTSYACSTKQKLSVWETLRFLWTWTPHWVIFQHPFTTHSFSWCRGENCTRVPKRSASYIITHLTSIGVIYYTARDGSASKYSDIIGVREGFWKGLGLTIWRLRAWAVTWPYVFRNL